MYNKRLLSQDNTSIEVNTSAEGETIEEKIDRIVNNQEPITDGAPLIYTDKNETNWQHDIRTDKHELMIEARNKIQRDELTKDVNIQREQREAAEKNKGKTDQNDGKSQET